MNHSGCLKAYRGEIIEIDANAPMVCPECGKPLEKSGGGGGGALKVIAILGAVAVVGAGAFFGMKAFKNKPRVVAGEPTPAASTPSTPLVSNTPAPTPISSTPPKSSKATPPKEVAVAPVVADSPPAAPTASSEEVTDSIRKAVTDRIDKMPGLPAEKKDRLYNSVQRARAMRKVVEINFGKGQTDIPANFQDQVKKLLEMPEVMKFRDDLTAVFVVLGFADGKGDSPVNLQVTRARAENVVKFMESKCAVRNVTHAVAMGGTTLVDKDRPERNRSAEIWAVLP